MACVQLQIVLVLLHVDRNKYLISVHLFTNLSMFCQAAEVLGHPHLRPYVLKIHQKLNSPRRNTFPVDWSQSSYITKTRFMEPEAIPAHTFREKRRSYSNDRTLNPSISGTEQDSPCSSLGAQEFPSCLNHKFTEVSIGSAHEGYGIKKSVATKFTVVNTPRSTPAKVSANPRRQITQSKISHVSSKRDSVSSY